jgi:hypothetical protein
MVMFTTLDKYLLLTAFGVVLLAIFINASITGYFRVKIFLLHRKYIEGIEKRRTK